MKVLFLTQTSELGASSRYRVYQYAQYLKREGIELDIVPALPDKVLIRLNEVSKIYLYGVQAVRRMFDLARLRHYDVIFLQRDMVIHLYPLLEKVAATINPNIIFDFDDAIHLYPSNKRPNLIFNLLWDRRKIERIIGLSKQIIVSNNFLKSYAEQFSKNVTLIPISIDLNRYRKNINPKELSKDLVKIGWMGSPGTFFYLKTIFPMFRKLARKYRLEIRVVGAEQCLIDGLPITYKEWSQRTEVDDLIDFDIGVMPLTDDQWSRGKSGTKLLQYMAAGVPAVASPIGINSEIVKDGVNGFLADNDSAWIKKISILIEDQQLRKQIVNNARRDIEQSYSTETNALKLARLIKSVAE